MKKEFFVFAIIFLFGVYFIYQSRNVFAKPEIQVNGLSDYNIVESSFLPVEGRITDSVGIQMNGRKIFVDENGFFKEDLILALGYNIIEIKAKDRFNHESVKKYIVMLDTNYN